MSTAPVETVARAADRSGSAGRPALFDRPRWSPESPAAQLFSNAGGDDEAQLLRRCQRTAVARAGLFARALTLLPEREAERAALLLALTDVLFATAHGEGTVEERVENLDRIAFAIARALRADAAHGEAEPFARRFGAEARRRSFTRQALDDLFDAARTAAKRRRPESGDALAARARRLSEAFTTALFGTEPTPAVIDLGAGIVRLLALQRLAADLREHRSGLPESDLPEPIQYRSVEEVGAAAEREVGELRQLLLKGARAAGEVPLSFRRPIAFVLPVSLALLGLVEERPQELARRTPSVGGWKLRRAYWRARFTPLG